MENKEPTPEELRTAKELWHATCERVTALHDMAQKRPELLRPIARQMFLWPGFISRKRAFNKANTELMNRIELGVGGPYSSKQWRIEAPSTQLAMRLHSVFQNQKYAKQLGLPPLTTKKNKRIWFEKIWNYIENDLHIEPEKNPDLANLGRAAITRNINASPKDQRAEIKKQVWNAFNGLIAGAEK
jgi:hypothetical protein